MEDFPFNTFAELYETCISRLDPAQTILIYKDNKVTVDEFIHTVKRYTRCFRELGIERGSRVGLNFPDCPEIFYAFIALSLSGACIVPMHFFLPALNKAAITYMCDAHIVFSDSNNLAGFRDELKKNGYACSLVTLEKNSESDCSLDDLMTDADDSQCPVTIPGADDAIVILPSTGTSGLPKYVELTQRNAVNIVKANKYFMEPVEDFKNGCKILSAFPLAGFPLIISFADTLLGLTAVILDDYSPVRFLSLVEQLKIDILAATPAYYEALIGFPGINNYNTDSVKRVYSGMDFLPNKRLLRIKEHFKNMRIASIGYGLTETSSVVMVFRAFKEKDFYLPTNYMTPVPGIGNEIEIINTNGEIAEIGEQGEIIMKGFSVIKEYYKNPLETERAFRKDGWFRTGDLGCMDEEGRIHLLGRLKSIIKRGGRSISPVVINNHLMKYHSVKTSAVVGVPHIMYGEMIWAFIVKGKDQSITKGDIMKHCRNGLPPYMIPDHISFIDSLPRKPGIGKINNKELINIALKELEKMSGGINEE